MWRRLAVGLVLALLLAACGDDGGSEDGAPAGPDPTYPPNSIEALAEIFDPQLEPMGLRFTRGGLFDRSDGGYSPSDVGEHLALYVEPLDDAAYDSGDYVDGLGTITALVTPQVFETWAGVQTYDICQEPPAEVDDRAAPAPYTQIEIDRATSGTVDWDTATTATVLDLARAGDLRLVVTPAVSADPAYLEAEAEAAA